MSYLILIDKPKGVTSFRAVAEIKKKLHMKRVGHCGTLDPMATGVLPVLTGRAARLSSYMLAADKRYTAGVRLGITTDTLDITGQITGEFPVSIDDERLKAALSKFQGEIMQVPPMYSALKRDGVRLYELARRGEEVKREPRAVTIHEINLIHRLNETDFLIDVFCSKGTYIRTLADDIGKALGCGAALFELRRTEAAGFTADECTPLEKIISDDSNTFLKDPQLCVMHLPKVTVTEAQANRFKNGGGLSLDRLRPEAQLCDEQQCRVLCGEKFLGLGQVSFSKEELTVTCIVSED